MPLIDTALMAKLPEELWPQLLGRLGSCSQMLDLPWDHEYRIPLELWMCRKNVLVVKVLLVLTKHLPCMASSCQVGISLNFIISTETKHPGQEFLKRKH